jgi:integrase/recombinase XerC
MEAVMLGEIGVVQEFLCDVQRSEATLKAYQSDIRGFIRWFEAEYKMPFSPDQLTSVDLRYYREFCLDAQKMSAASWNRKRIALRMWCDYLKRNQVINGDPSRELASKAVQENPPRWLNRSEMGHFQRQMERSVLSARSEFGMWLALRDAAMIGLMLYGGLREGEVAGLDVGDVELRERSGQVQIRKGTGDKAGTVPLNGEARKLLAGWLAVRSRGGGALFVNRYGERVGTRTIQRVVGELGKRAGVKVTPHDLRHTCAKRLLDTGSPLTVVQKVLRHSRLETTARYVKPGWEDLEKAVERI